MSVQPRKVLCLMKRLPVASKREDGTNTTMDNLKFRFEVHTKSLCCFPGVTQPFPAGSLLPSCHLPRNWRRRARERGGSQKRIDGPQMIKMETRLYRNRIQGAPDSKKQGHTVRCQPVAWIRIHFPLEILYKNAGTPQILSNLLC